MQPKRGHNELRGIPRLWVMVLCFISFGMGHAFNGAYEYGLPMAAETLAFSPSSSSETKASSAVQQMAEELIKNTLGKEMLGQADKIPPEELKKSFYKALGATIGSNANAVVRQQQQENPAAVESRERNFLAVARTASTDKVQGHKNLQKCTEDDSNNGCLRKGCKNVGCIPWGHFYDTFYQSQLGHLSRSDAKPFQALEIGFYRGSGFQTYERWLPNAEMHIMEISCLPPGPRNEGKWPFDNFAEFNKTLYKRALAKGQLHCGDASNIEWINKTWTNDMKRGDAPPLKLVIDDGSHLARHMAQTLFFWFRRIEPGGHMVVEDIQPIDIANQFRTQLMPQIMTDLHYCGEPRFPNEGPCFPTIQPLLESIYCELHICLFKINDKPAQELSPELSTMPPSALDASKCPSLRRNSWET
jgi:hypothetical protein